MAVVIIRAKADALQAFSHFGFSRQHGGSEREVDVEGLHVRPHLPVLAA